MIFPEIISRFLCRQSIIGAEATVSQILDVKILLCKFISWSLTPIIKGWKSLISFVTTTYLAFFLLIVCKFLRWLVSTIPEQSNKISALKFILSKLIFFVIVIFFLLIIILLSEKYLNYFNCHRWSQITRYSFWWNIWII